MAAAAGAAKVLTSFLASAAPAAASAGSAAAGAAQAAAPFATAAGGLATVASALQQPGAPKSVASPVPDNKLALADKQRKLAMQYAEQGRVGSVFGKDKLG